MPPPDPTSADPLSLVSLIISVVGTLASLIGLGVAAYQAKKARAAADAARIAAERATAAMILLASLSNGEQLATLAQALAEQLRTPKSYPDALRTAKQFHALAARTLALNPDVFDGRGIAIVDEIRGFIEKLDQPTGEQDKIAIVQIKSKCLSLTQTFLVRSGTLQKTSEK